MITFEDVLETMGRVYYDRSTNEHIVLLSDNDNKKALHNIEKGLEISGKLYNRKCKVKAINTESPLEYSKQFKNETVRFLFLDYPKSLEFFNDVLKSWGERICFFGAIMFRGNYEDEELEKHPIDERYVGALHGIYRTDPPLTIIYKKWGMPYVK